LLSITDWLGLAVLTNWVAKIRLVGTSVAFGPEVTPVPLNATDCGLAAALSVIVTDALRGPIWVGLKITEIVQCAPGNKLEPQLFVWLKSLGLVPATTMLLTASVIPPVFVRVTVWEGLMVPTN
jgi:hypothetical protein